MKTKGWLVVVVLSASMSFGGGFLVSESVFDKLAFEAKALAKAELSEVKKMQAAKITELKSAFDIKLNDFQHEADKTINDLKTQWKKDAIALKNEKIKAMKAKVKKLRKKAK